jgi:hypothetical protein
MSVLGGRMTVLTVMGIFGIEKDVNGPVLALFAA